MRRDHIEYPHGVEKYRENGHPTQFPAERQDAILEDPHICELEQQLKLMTLEKAGDFEMSITRKQIQVQENTVSK